MANLLLSPPLLGFVVGTRAALAFGAGLLLSSRIPEARRKTIGLSLVAIGALTTIPAAISVLRRRTADADDLPDDVVVTVARVVAVDPIPPEF